MTTATLNGLDISAVYRLFSGLTQIVSYNSNQFILTDLYSGPNQATLTVNGNGLTYGYSQLNLLTGGTLTSLTLQMGSGESETWSGFNVSALAAYNALALADLNGFANLFFGGNDTFNVTTQKAPSAKSVYSVAAKGYDGDDTFNFTTPNKSLGGFGFDGGAGNDTLNLAGGLSGTAYAFDFRAQLPNFEVRGANPDFNIVVETVRLAAGNAYTFITDGPGAGKTMTLDGSALGAADTMIVDTNLLGDKTAAGNLVLLGGAANDIFKGGTGDDVFNGGAGTDWVSYVTYARATDGKTGVSVDLSKSGPQAVGLGLGNDTFIGIENLFGSAFNDRLLGDAGANILNSGGGNDFLYGGAGDDTLIASSGGNTEAHFIVDARGITVNLQAGTAVSASEGNDTLTNIHIISVEGYNATLTGTDLLNDTLIADKGSNTLLGGGGDDYLHDAGANSLLDGGSGDDAASLDRAPVHTPGTNPQDPAYTLTFTPGNMTLADGTQLKSIEHLFLKTGNGNDSLTFLNPVELFSLTPAGAPDRSGWDAGGGYDTVTVDMSGFQSGVKMVAGALPQEITIVGNDYLAQLYFHFLNVESFHIAGSRGNDVLLGGSESDIFTGNAGNDAIDGGGNIDTAVFAGNLSAYTITQGSPGVFTIARKDGSDTDTLTRIEYAQFTDQTVRLMPGTGVTLGPGAAPASYMSAIRDFDGNNFTGLGTQVIDPGSGGLVAGGAWDGVSGWTLAGSADVSGSGLQAQVLFNSLIGRWAEVTTESDGKVYFDNHGWAGDTRIVGIYVDPEVTAGHAVQGGPDDSQRRFQNDLFIGNLKSVLGAGDYNHDGFQEVYFSLTDGTAYLHAIMWNDGNIQYANYQSAQQVQDYLNANSVPAGTWSSWLQEAPPMVLAASGAMAPLLGQDSGAALAGIAV